MKISKTAPKNWDFFNEHGASLGAYQLIGFIGQILSGLSLVYAVYSLILAEVLKRSGQAENTLPLLGMALLVGLFVELANRILARRAIKPLVKNGMFQEDDELHHRHVVLNRSYMTGLVIIALTSYFLSGVGSSYYADDSTEDPALIDVDSLKRLYDEKLVSLDAAFVRDTQLISAPFITRIRAAENRFQADSLALRKEREKYRSCATAGNQWCKNKLNDYLARIDRARGMMNDSIGWISSQQSAALLATLKDRNGKADQLSREKGSEVSQANDLNRQSNDEQQRDAGFKGLVFIILTFIGQTVFYLMVYLTLQVEAGSEINYEVEPNELWTKPPVLREFWTTLAWKMERGARYLIYLIFGEPRASVITEIPYRGLKEKTDKPQINGVKMLKPLSSPEPKKAIEKPAGPNGQKNGPFTEQKKDFTLADLKQKLVMYKKRHSRAIQKKISAESKGEVVKYQTLKAIDNNKNWVEHYTELIAQKKAELQAQNS